jgi:hypothetical protein
MMKFEKIWMLAASAAALAWAGEAQAASFISQSYAVADTVSGNLVNSAGFNFSPFDVQRSVHVGSVADTFLGRFGADATGTVGATLKFYGGVSLTVPTSTALTAHGTLNATSKIGFVDGRGYFSVHNSIDPAQIKSTFGTGDVSANLSEQIFAGAHLDARACFVKCKGGDIVTFGIGNPKPFDILRYDSPSNSTTFFGDVTHDVLPRHYDAGHGLPLSLDLHALDLSGTTVTGTTDTYHTQQELVGAYVDVAGAVGNAFGIPDKAFHGKVLGFDYTTISAKVGLALNAVYDAVTSSAGSLTNYFFSTPMEFRRGNTWVGVGRSVALDNSQSYDLRPADSSVTTISALPVAMQMFNTSAHLSLQAALEDHVRILELHGHGLDAGPLFRQDGSIILDTIGQFASNTSLISRTALRPFKITVTNSQGTGGIGTGGGPVNQANSNFVFIPNPVLGPGPNVLSAHGTDANLGNFGGGGERTVESGQIVLVTNYGTPGCDDFSTSACILDPDFNPIYTERKTDFADDGTPIFSYSSSFDDFNGFAGLGIGNYGDQTTVEQLLASLQVSRRRGQTINCPIRSPSTPIPGFPTPSPNPPAGR